MNIITTKNELFQTELACFGIEIYLLYHSEEISLLIHAISDLKEILSAYASLYGAAPGIFLSPGSSEEGRYPRNGAYASGGKVAYITPAIIDGPPTLGEIPCHYRGVVGRTLELFTQRTVKGHEHLQRKLREALNHL